MRMLSKSKHSCRKSVRIDTLVGGGKVRGLGSNSVIVLSRGGCASFGHFSGSKGRTLGLLPREVRGKAPFRMQLDGNIACATAINRTIRLGSKRDCGTMIENTQISVAVCSNSVPL